MERDSVAATAFLRPASCSSPSDGSSLYLRAASLCSSSCAWYCCTVILLAFMHAAACETAKGRWNSSLSRCMASCCSASESGLVKRFCSILSAATGVSSCSGIVFCGASASAVSLSVVVKTTEHSLERGRKSAKSVASLADEPLDCAVVPSALSKISKHRRVLISATQHLTTFFMSAWSSSLPRILSFCATLAYDR